ncbi:hypothetical protein N7532_002973 [Penicillium argentinense]|uniref:Uncharacterized protein n=1 Tax=Penicillium argentinense TaxID=1131581 RepID=A0A9W9G1N4_9EURO|nr:uncharacterized protein N7532_009729 [Penicillium argentinense]XP_056470907.1 uncharacterized protein N7532_011000 [Penicillium argentinense]XP_056473032.1 uncharacterized protein N7532_007173 [Penicillium argentinense]XP_056473462.1 uncharacterized protein N7532_004809 [Penicillium argentinense]XP_056475824.1 uncharacterized protein N7532_007172 [Penicillium argentinense]XP_056478439.1 uncharacterized protein N7532_002973 [Penicillium argentinense]KAJ5084958.1 hypothetical protein N7532_0
MSLNIINIPQHHQYPSTSSISLNIINIPQHHQYPSTSSISLNIINIPQHHQYPSTPTTLKTLIKTRNTDNPTVSPPYSYHRPLTILYTPGKPTPTLPPIHPTPPLLRITNAPSSSPIHILSPSFPSIFFTRPCAPGLYVPPLRNVQCPFLLANSHPLAIFPLHPFYPSVCPYPIRPPLRNVPNIPLNINHLTSCPIRRTLPDIITESLLS